MINNVNYALYYSMTVGFNINHGAKISLDKRQGIGYDDYNKLIRHFRILILSISNLIYCRGYYD